MYKDQIEDHVARQEVGLDQWPISYRPEDLREWLHPRVLHDYVEWDDDYDGPGMLDQNDVDNNFAMHNGFGGAMNEDSQDEDQLDAAMPAVDYPVVDLADVAVGNNSSNIAYFDVSCILSADIAPATIGEAPHHIHMMC